MLGEGQLVCSVKTSKEEVRQNVELHESVNGGVWGCELRVSSSAASPTVGISGERHQ